jgi:hypothetical protein
VRVSYQGNHSCNVPTNVNADQPRVNTAGFTSDATQSAIPYPLFGYIATNTNFGFGNYNAGTVSVHKRALGLQFEASYTYTGNLTNLYGCGTGANNFITEGAFNNALCDPYNPSIDYGNTPFDRRHRFLATLSL